MGCVYKVSNTENTLVYIGGAKNIISRINGHKYQALTKKASSKLHVAIREIGWEKFRFEIIEICENEKIFEQEKHWIKVYNSMWPNGYNQIDSSLRGAKRSHELQINYSKSVVLFDLETNKTLEFASAKDACRYLNLSVSAVSSALYRVSILQKRFVVKYKEDQRSLDDLLKFIEQKRKDSFNHLSKIRKGKTPPNVRKVKLTNINTSERIIFNTIKEAAKYLNRQTTNISHACKKKGRIVNGYFAEYIENNTEKENSCRLM